MKTFRPNLEKYEATNVDEGAFTTSSDGLTFQLVKLVPRDQNTTHPLPDADALCITVCETNKQPTYTYLDLWTQDSLRQAFSWLLLIGLAADHVYRPFDSTAANWIFSIVAAVAIVMIASLMRDAYTKQAYLDAITTPDNLVIMARNAIPELAIDNDAIDQPTASCLKQYGVPTLIGLLSAAWAAYYAGMILHDSFDTDLGQRADSLYHITGRHHDSWNAIASLALLLVVSLAIVGMNRAYVASTITSTGNSKSN